MAGPSPVAVARQGPARVVTLVERMRDEHEVTPARMTTRTQRLAVRLGHHAAT